MGWIKRTSFIFAEEIESSVSLDECEKLAELAEGKTVLELGSWTGRSTVALASTAKVVHSVDWHMGDQHTGPSDSMGTFLTNLCRYGVRSKVVVHLGQNDTILPFLKAAAFDLVFVDSFHERQAVERDIALVRPLVTPDGVIAFHDFGVNLNIRDIPFGVTEAVQAFAAAEKRDIKITRSLAVVELKG